MTLKQDMDRANPNTVADALRIIKVGQTLASDIKQTRRNFDADDAGAGPFDLATLDILVLPEDARAMLVHRAYARAGGAGTGEMTVDPPNTTPGTGDIAVTPNGNIALLAADAITDVDIEYTPVRGDVVEFSGVPAAGILALPAQLTAAGVVLLLEAEAETGAVTGNKTVLAPAAGLPATLTARLDVAKANVQFNNATDAVTRGRVRLLIAADADLRALLESDQNLV